MMFSTQKFSPFSPLRPFRVFGRRSVGEWMTHRVLPRSTFVRSFSHALPKTFVSSYTVKTVVSIAPRALSFFRVLLFCVILRPVALPPTSFLPSFRRVRVWLPRNKYTIYIHIFYIHTYSANGETLCLPFSVSAGAAAVAAAAASWKSKYGRRWFS